MPTEPEQAATDHRLAAEPMRLWERIAALTTGITLAGVGCVAVFKTTNQAGTTALLLAAGVFLLIGIQGTSLVRVSGGSNAAEFERRLRQERFVETAAQEAGNNPDWVSGMMRGASILAPDIAPALTLAVAWNNMVRDVLIHAVPDCAIQTRPLPAAAGPISLVVRAPEGDIPVMLKQAGQSIEFEDIRTLSDYVTATSPPAIGGLALSSVEPTALVKFILATQEISLPIEAVAWAGPHDTARLVEAINGIREIARAPEQDQGTTDR